MADVAKYSASSYYGDNIIRDFSQGTGYMEKPPCLPGYNCEDVTKCAPVSFEDQNNEGEFLHGNPKTTCVPAESYPLREGEWNYYYYNRQGTTTSTMAPMLADTTTSTSTTKKKDDDTTTEVLRCDNVAKCSVHQW
ncbi:unnamed protein product [Diatraea saccharalis]|uniref:Uncharacterized protein n=1 Tax=Diatraea saccharalis TaxID=40085 RepID=A0A9N9QWI1_9NEOP|nr:unnamed protein product [Diatraea saccharalis]